MSDDDDPLYTDIRQAIRDTFGRHGIVHIKHALIVEGLDDTGERAIWLIPSEGASTWDTLGLLAFVTARETATAAGDDE